MSLARDAALGLGLGLVVVGAAWYVARKLDGAAGELVGTIGDVLGAAGDAIAAGADDAAAAVADGAGSALDYTGALGQAPADAGEAINFAAWRGFVPPVAASAAAFDMLRRLYLWAWTGDAGDYGPPVN